jgi:hypothetical protein
MFEVNPSNDYAATCLSVAWAIVLRTHLRSSEKDEKKIAQKVIDVYLMLTEMKPKNAGA